ncbi:aminotransferase class I/II-fold pyridoxal phosphate-dependent enzyme [Nonomuraea sp. MG754425]|uniref:aminotransferase class I/II-fold pyridoxal phosphate-dependent enzyme n=1 Tax=Nonomuraea sp. MG754425 TaxID=2570319 RepID=UPI001F01BC69|nr:aminotransferase class I/II-fold pyridoxal phosphate-dependent enzyme [Nonomuraea sp. MG754425]MCF6473397.1 aminotransferase class I/II-fold pyridoxal phosphate-dependent enzyme [Nonomuraea sp. MG754425]
MRLNEHGWPVWPQTDDDTAQAVNAALLSRRMAVSGTPSRWRSRNEIAARALAAALGRSHAVLTSSGSGAIVVALQALGVGPGDAVLVPATTWVSCATAIMRVGARPVFFDARHDSLSRLGDHPDVPIRAILAVHLYAEHANIDELRATFPGAPIVEDASHSHLAVTDDGRRVGTLGDISIMSLQASKVLTSGEGGAVCTDDPEIASRVESLVTDSRRRNPAAASNAACELEPALLLHGANFALSELSAALLQDQLSKLPNQLLRRSLGASFVIGRLVEAGWRVFADEGALRSGGFYGVAVEIPAHRGDRGTVLEEVRARCGLALDTVYPPIPEGPLYRPETVSRYAHIGHVVPALPWSRKWHHDCVVLPHHAFLAGERQLDLLVGTLLGERRTTTRPEAEPCSIDVVVITTGTRDTLWEALDSIERQDVRARVRVSVLIDSPEERVGKLTAGLRSRYPHYRVVVDTDQALSSLTPFERIARLRQNALGACHGDYTAFLDDDNRWEPTHLSSLLKVARSGFPAVHSWRVLVDRSGSPVTVDRFPWLPPGPDSYERFKSMVADGIMSPDDNVVKDSSTGGMVDMGAWLFDTRLLRSLKFERPHTAAEVRDRVGEDDILLEQLNRLDVPTGCTREATLVYRLGGMSNEEYAEALVGN